VYLPFINIQESKVRPFVSNRIEKLIQNDRISHTCINALLKTQLIRFNQQGIASLYSSGMEIENKELFNQFNEEFIYERLKQLEKVNKATLRTVLVENSTKIQD